MQLQMLWHNGPRIVSRASDFRVTRYLKTLLHLVISLRFKEMEQVYQVAHKTDCAAGSLIAPLSCSTLLSRTHLIYNSCKIITFLARILFSIQMVICRLHKNKINWPLRGPPIGRVLWVIIK